jgi:hypothetical protein
MDEGLDLAGNSVDGCQSDSVPVMIPLDMKNADFWDDTELQETWDVVVERYRQARSGKPVTVDFRWKDAGEERKMGKLVEEADVSEREGGETNALYDEAAGAIDQKDFESLLLHTAQQAPFTSHQFPTQGFEEWDPVVQSLVSAWYQAGYASGYYAAMTASKAGKQEDDHSREADKEAAVQIKRRKR